MFLCHCSSCGRRELRGPRSLSLSPTAATASCRACDAEVVIQRFAHEPSAPLVAA